MLQRILNKLVFRFGLTKYSSEIINEILPTAPQLNKPQVIDTASREKYRE